MLYLQIVNRDSDQRKGMESIFAPSQNCHRHLMEQPGLPHFYQKDKSSEAREPRTKTRFDRRKKVDEI